MRRQPRAKGGFTLMEVVVAIALLSILSFVVTGGYAGYQAAAQDYTAQKALGVLQDAYLYARTTSPDDSAAVAQVGALVSDELQGHYSIAPAGDHYTITYESNGKTYTLTDGQVVEDLPVADPIQRVTELTGKVYEDMHTVTSDLKDASAKDKHKYFQEHGYTHPNNSLGNDAYRSYLFNTVYEGSWPEVSQEFCDQYGLPSGLYIQPYVKDLNDPDTVVVFANGNNSTGGNWYAHLICIDGVWYYGSKNGLSVTMDYEELKRKVTTTWEALQ